MHRSSSLFCLVFLQSVCSLSFAQTRPLGNAFDQEQARIQAEADALAAARAWRFEPSVGVTLTATNNSGLISEAGNPESDLILDIEPRLLIRGRGAYFTLQGDIGARRLTYVDSTQPNRLFPSGTLALNATLVERWLYFDTSFGVDQIASDPFAPRADGDSGADKINTVQYRVSPYLQHSFTPSFSVLARSDNNWTRRRGDFAQTDPRRNSEGHRNSVILEQRPLPLGFSIEAAQETTKYTSVVENVLEIGSARAILTYAVDPTFVIGLTAGSEKSKYGLTESTDSIAGGRISWAPTERTELKGSYERRFFGTGGALEWTHRSPFISFYVNVSREPTALGTSFVLNPNAGDIRTLLDQIFTTRYPNPVERAVIVNGVISGLGVPSNLGEPVEVFANYPQLRESATVSAIFQGLRTTVIARGYGIRSQQLLSQQDLPVAPTLGAGVDSIQKGGSLDFNRRLNSTLSMDLGASYASIEGIGILSGQSTTNKAVRLGFVQAVTRRTSATVGARYLLTDLTVAGQEATVKEVAAFVGLTHRF